MIKKCKFTIKLTNDIYIFIANKKLYHFYDIYEISNKIDEININCSYIYGIPINNIYCVFTSNKVINGGKDILDFYNVFQHKIDLKLRIKQYSFIKSTFGLTLITSENLDVIILLCACRKYKKNQKNGILLLVIKKTKDNLINKSNAKKYFYNTENFEVHCFKQIYYFDNYKLNLWSIGELRLTNFILVGGFDNELGRGIIKLYKIIDNENIDKIKIEYIQDLNINDYKFKGNIYFISQSMKTGNISALCSDNNYYNFNINNFIKQNFYDKKSRYINEIFFIYS